MILWLVLSQVEITVVTILLQVKEGLGRNLKCVPALYHVARVNKETSSAFEMQKYSIPSEASAVLQISDWGLN